MNVVELPSFDKIIKEPGITRVKNIIAVGSGKGGVGKSTVTTNLAIALQLSGAKVGLMDADIYGACQPGMMGALDQKATSSERGYIVPTDCHGVQCVSMGLLVGNESPVIWRAPMAMKVVEQFIAKVEWGELDYLLVDLPPGTGDVQLTLAQQAALTGAVIVSTPQNVALEIAKKGLKMFQKVKVPILGVVENMSGEIFGDGGAEKMAKALKVPFLGKIPLDATILKCGDKGLPVLLAEPESKAAEAYIKLAENFKKEVIRSKEEEKKLIPKEMNLSADGKLMIHWADGKVGSFNPYKLRIECPCAMCTEEMSGKRLLDPNTVPKDIAIRSFEPMGRYAVGVKFSDGHRTGLYSYDRLRST